MFLTLLVILTGYEIVSVFTKSTSRWGQAIILRERGSFIKGGLFFADNVISEAGSKTANPISAQTWTPESM